MDKWSEIRTKLVDAQEELYKIEDEYRQSKNELDIKWSFLNDFYKGFHLLVAHFHNMILPLH